MSTPARFSDGKYKNWLKCSQSLIIMKEALHDYIDNAVKKLHGDIILKVSSIPCGSSTGNQCGSCSWRNIKLTGGRHGTWSINCKNSICDKWLHQILAVHDDPHNPTINWKNADISKWPTECYQVAKIFMPKGQGKTMKMPDDLDAPAILSLMKYCNWFRTDLPNTHILSDLIDIRNKVLHSGDLRVADSDTDIWIDLMIQLLCDLNIHGNALADLQKLKREDIDLNFRETEIRVFRMMVNGLVSDLTSVKVDIYSLQDSHSELSKDMTKLRENDTKAITKVDTVQADLKEMRKALDELKIICDKRSSFFDQNPDIHETEFSKTITKIGTKVKVLQQTLFTIETEQKELKSKVSVLEMQQEETRQQMEETKKSYEAVKRNIEGLDKRLSSIEKQKENEYPGQKRPETDSLKQLKNQTEDTLDTLIRLQYIPTKQAEKAKELLEGKRSIVIRGNPGEGKTAMALYLIDNEIYRYRRVVLHVPHDWKTVDTDWVDIVILDDMLGHFDLDSGYLQEWMVYLPTIQEHIDAGKLRVIITTRDDILSKALFKLGSLKLFSDDLSVMLSSKDLRDSEKISILNRQLQRHEKHMKEDEKETCIANFRGLIGFPQCCLIFAGDSKLFDEGPQFFISPKKFFVANISELEDTTFLSLVFLFCNNNILEENLSPESMRESSKSALTELASYLKISEKKASITLLRDAYDAFLDLYVVKSMRYDSESGLNKPCIGFTHTIVKEAVGQVLGGRCPEMIVKYGDSEYLYQRTYTAKDKDNTSQNVFIPASVYGLLAERMVQDVVKKILVRSVAKYSALKQHDILMKMKFELQKGNRIKDFFMAKTFSFHSNLLKGECDTFMQCILQSDTDVARSVYSELLELLACTHDNNIPDCWQCKEKQKLLELALYYHHFEIADKLITMKASYTHVSLCNAARHDDFGRVQSILETLKSNKVFSPNCVEAKDTLCRAYLSGMQRSIELLLKEGIVLGIIHVAVVVEHGNLNVLMKVVEHLKCHNRWKSSMNLYVGGSLKATNLSTKSYFRCYAMLAVAYSKEKFDMADYLLKNEVKVSLDTLAVVSSNGSQAAVARVIQNLKDSDDWNPKCDIASKILQTAYSEEKYDVCDLLDQEGVSLTMKNLHGIIDKQISFKMCQVSLETVKKVIQHLKDTDNWDPKCDDASQTLEYAYSSKRYDLCDLLVQEQVSLTLKNLPGVMKSASSECIQKAIQHLKDTDSWDPMCDDASIVLEKAYVHQKYDVCDQLVQEGVLLTIENLPGVVNNISLETIKNMLQDWKETDNWHPKCEDGYQALNNAYWGHRFDVCDLLVQEGVTPTMRNLQVVIDNYGVSLQTLKNAVEHLKVIGNWDPKCDDASNSLAKVYGRMDCDICDLLVHEGISPTMKNLLDVMGNFDVSLKIIKNTIQHLKDTRKWDPKCDYASKALQKAFASHANRKCGICDLLVQEGVSLTMNNLLAVMTGYNVSLKIVKKIIQHLKDKKNWNSKCDDALNALENAYSKEQYYVCNLLVQEGVSLTMKNIASITEAPEVSFESVKKVIQHLKDTHNWNPKCDDASKALENAHAAHSDWKNDVCYLLLQEGVPIRMHIFPSLINTFRVSLEHVKKAIQDLKDSHTWDSKCNHASKALSNAYSHQKYDVCDLLVQEGVSLRMENLNDTQEGDCVSMETMKKAIEHLKDTDNWDPQCNDASKALENAYRDEMYDVCDLLVQEGVTPTMKHLLCLMGYNYFANTKMFSLKTVKKVIQHLKVSHNWDPTCDDASNALANGYLHNKHVVCNLMIHEGVSLTMKNLPTITVAFGVSLGSVTKVIQHLKDTHNWNPKCDDASKALENAHAGYNDWKNDVRYLLLQEGVPIRMNIFPSLINTFRVSLEHVKKAIQDLKDSHTWDSRCNHASKALSNAYSHQKYDVCDLLVQEGVSLRMENLNDIQEGDCVSMETMKKAIEHLKDTDNWDPQCNDASKALENAYRDEMYDVCDLLVQEGVTPTMKHLLCLMGYNYFANRNEFSLKTVKKVIQHLKVSHNWDPTCDDASKALENAYIHNRYDVCDLLIQARVSLTMKDFAGLTKVHHELCMSFLKGSLESVKEAMKHLKATHNWDPMCDDASRALENAYIYEEYDVCDLLVQERVTPTMKLLHGVITKEVSLETVTKIIQHLKGTHNWNPKCHDASKALEIAYICDKHVVCNLLIQERVSLKMKNFPGITKYHFDLTGIFGKASLESVKKAIQHLKDTKNWDPKCADASKALENVYDKYWQESHDVCNLLVQEGVSLTNTKMCVIL